MSLENDVRRLAKTRPFSFLPREALQLLAFSCPKRVGKAGETLFLEGEPAGGAFFVLSGELLLTARGEEKRVGPGALIGENALTIEVDRSAEAKFASDATLLVVSREVFARVLSEFPEGAVKMRAAAAARTRQLIKGLDAVRARAFEV